MKKIASILLAITLTFIFTGCNSNANSIDNMSPIEVVQTYGEDSKEVMKLNKKNSGLTKEVVMENIEKSLSDVKSTSAEYSITSKMLDDKGNKKSDTMGLSMTTKSIYNDKGELKEVYVESKQKTQDNTDEVYFASFVDMEKNKAFYDDGSGMKAYEVTEDSKLQVNNESEYRNTIKMMIMASKFMDFSEDENNYYLTFIGINGDLFYMIDGLFGLGIDVLNLNDVGIEIKYTIRKADFQLSEVYHKANQIYENQNYEFEGKFSLKTVNKFDKIEEVEGLIIEENKEDKKAA